MTIIPRKPNGRPALNFYGYDDGTYIETSDYLLSWGSQGYDWEMITGLTSSHQPSKGNAYHVTGAVEQNSGFLAALQDMANYYPELSYYLIDFDGPSKTIAEVLQNNFQLKWENIEFLHGTSSNLLPHIRYQGLLPRSITGMPATYGASISSALPGKPEAIYLTTQQGTAKWAAKDAVNLHGGSKIILKIKGIDGSFAIPDVDSKKMTAEDSLCSLGSIGYLAPIPPSLITIS